MVISTAYSEIPTSPKIMEYFPIKITMFVSPFINTEWWKIYNHWFIRKYTEQPYVQQVIKLYPSKY